MRSLLLIIIFIISSCGRPHSSEQESNEVRKRERLETLNQEYKEVTGHYSGTLELTSDSSMFNATADLRIVQDVDPSTGLPLQPKIIGSISVFELINNSESLLISYGITNGSFDNKTGQLALDISDKLTIRGSASHNVINAVLHSSIKGDVGKLKLVRDR